jgi:hypothetical protein
MGGKLTLFIDRVELSFTDLVQVFYQVSMEDYRPHEQSSQHEKQENIPQRLPRNTKLVPQRQQHNQNDCGTAANLPSLFVSQRFRPLIACR